MTPYNKSSDDKIIVGLNNYIAKELSPKLFVGDPPRFTVTSPGHHKPTWILGHSAEKSRRKKSAPKLDLTSTLQYIHPYPLTGDTTNPTTVLNTVDSLCSSEVDRDSSVSNASSEVAVNIDDPNMDSPTIPGRPALPHINSNTIPIYKFDYGPQIEDPLLSTIDEAIDNCLLIELQQLSPQIRAFLEPSHAMYTPTQSSLTVSSPRRFSDANMSNSACSPRTVMPINSPAKNYNLKSRREQFRNFKFDSYGKARVPVMLNQKPQYATSPEPAPRCVETIPEIHYPRHYTSRIDSSEGTTVLNRRIPTITEKRRAARQKIFDTLPDGCKAIRAHDDIELTDIDVLRAQALGQAAKFEVLKPKDVDVLSRELRSLDERCGYLRTTYKDLRSDRRGLQARICTLLRDSRKAIFSHDALLKQEEALAELDLSIDGWDTKLQIAENRRTRIRQKLLEHVAATITIPTASEAERMRSEKPLPSQPGLITPPRSPTIKIHARNEFDQPIHKDFSIPINRIVLPEMPTQSVLRKRQSIEALATHTTCETQKMLTEAEREIDRMTSVRKLVKKLEILGNTALLPEKCQALGAESTREGWEVEN